jgi:dinuclear metal center YbgI/SA1388 family protein
MTIVADIRRHLEQFAPVQLAEEWDNVGLLVGDDAQPVRKVMTCLTLTPTSTAEAVRSGANLVVAHHPLPFRPLKRLTSETTPGRMLLDLIKAGVAVYSPHTAFDSAAQGINQQLASALGLKDIRSLLPRVDEPNTLGSGRFGRLASQTTIGEIVTGLKKLLQAEHMQLVGASDRRVERIGVACGSAGSFLEPAIKAGCDLFITGEASFHTLSAITRANGLPSNAWPKCWSRTSSMCSFGPVTTSATRSPGSDRTGRPR